MTEILTPISTDHSPVLFSFSKKVLLEVKDFGNLIVPQLKTKFHFVILVASRLVNIIGCMNFLSSFLDVITMSMPMAYEYDLSGLKSRINRHLLSLGSF